MGDGGRERGRERGGEREREREQREREREREGEREGERESEREREREREREGERERERERGRGGWEFHLARLRKLWWVTFFMWITVSPCVASVPGAPHSLLAVSYSSCCRPTGPLAVDRPPFGPLAWRPSPAVPSKCWSRPPRRARGLCPPPGLPPAFLQEGSGGRCSGWTLCASAGRWGSPADARCAARRVRLPFGPLAWASLPLQSPYRARPDPPQGPGASPTPGAPRLRSSRRGRAAAARVGPLRASAGRWGSPADARRGPRLSVPASPRGSAPLHGRLCWGARGSRPL